MREWKRGRREGKKKSMYERRGDINRKATKRANWDCQVQQMQEAESLGEYGYLLEHENVFLAEEEV